MKNKTIISKQNLVLIVIMVGATLTDQLSKIWITSNLQLGESIEIIPSFFKITYAQNTGAAWSILEGQMTFFYVITLVALILLGWYFYRLKDYQIIQKIGVALMVSGTLGNFIDRLLFQYVRDSLDFHILGYNFPIFNVADVLLICGVLFIIIDEVLKSFGVSYKKM
ncbi:signal peptidase II [Carnobacterium divergens]|jgi:signal peptidase II (EC:3.4.23.36). Aspartic peptidase. MEROPS family A08|uniref:Lipoprotein signal peptidase n=1 Tax=Listeria monocytogenes serovar 1/2a (strain ATCC BAA-679 / EGD-e) TaxID=169963 RepID=Q8Y818_LISMO|nr:MULTISPECIES: signal peptidase II [Bacilli]NP_464626.1 lipoprotein signal peptidase [Listeria monocytogenes EGD-e]EAC4976907.1 signal peptidase II [Listeria monocytogenes]EAC8292564.1 signal peptidase II [Listeria monocytogenes]EAC9100664.1 signal peptidase II [Listeria monocytogenes]EAD1487906.1 signal peptidase II [Listeria monocytogenes]EAD2036364.1 signal peptidase II [Listeria monocytogenes]